MLMIMSKEQIILAWNNKYWDLKRLLRYLPKDYELLIYSKTIINE